MAETRVRPLQTEEVGKAGYGDPEVGAWIVVGPFVGESTAVATHDIESCGHLRDLESRGEHDDVAWSSRSIGSDDSFGIDMRNGIGDQLDPGLEKSSVPAVVEQDPLSVGRVVGQTLGDQVLTSLEFPHDVIGHLLAVEVVATIDRSLRVRPIRILLQMPEQTVGVTPRHREAVPRRVVRQVVDEPLGAVGNRVVITLDGAGPLRTALVHGECRDRVGDLRHDLHGRGAGPDHGDRPTTYIEIFGPAGTVERPSGEGVDAVDRRQFRNVQLSDRTDEDRGIDSSHLVADPDVDEPPRRVVVPHRALDRRTERDVRRDPELVGGLLEILLEFGLGTEVARPAMR